MEDFERKIYCHKCNKEMFERIKDGKFETDVAVVMNLGSPDEHCLCKDCDYKYKMGNNPSGKPVVEIKDPKTKDWLLERIKQDIIKDVNGDVIKRLEQDIKNKDWLAMGFDLGVIASAIKKIDKYFPECMDIIKDSREDLKYLNNKAMALECEARDNGILPIK